MVYFKHEGGLSVPRMAICGHFTEFILVLDTCFIQIGENDLDRFDINNEDAGVAVVKLISNIVSFVNYLITGIGVRRVIVGQLFRRQLWVVKSASYDASYDSNIRFQQELLPVESAYFWHHREF